MNCLSILFSALGQEQTAQAEELCRRPWQSAAGAASLLCLSKNQPCTSSPRAAQGAPAAPKQGWGSDCPDFTPGSLEQGVYGYMAPFWVSRVKLPQNISFTGHCLFSWFGITKMEAKFFKYDLSHKL